MVDLTKKHYVSNKEKFTTEFLEKLYNSKLMIDGFPIYTNFPDRLSKLLDTQGVNFNELLKEAKITSKKPYAAMQYQLYADGYPFVVMAFMTEKFAYCYVYNITEPNFSDAGSVLLTSVVSSANTPF